MVGEIMLVVYEHVCVGVELDADGWGGVSRAELTWSWIGHDGEDLTVCWNGYDMGCGGVVRAWSWFRQSEAEL